MILEWILGSSKDDEPPVGTTAAREAAEEMVEDTGVGGMVDCILGYDVVVREPVEPGESCYHHEWPVDPQWAYDKPGPDPRNPIYVRECSECPAERHEGTGDNASKRRGERMIGPLDLDESRRAAINDDDDPPVPFDPAEGVVVREEDRGVMHYAVFDEGEQVSDTVGPLGEDYIFDFVEGYSEAKRRYSGD